MRRHIARTTRIMVVSPRPADIVALFNDEERVSGSLLEANTHAEAAKAAADDQDIYVGSRPVLATIGARSRLADVVVCRLHALLSRVNGLLESAELKR